MKKVKLEVKGLDIVNQKVKELEEALNSVEVSNVIYPEINTEFMLDFATFVLNDLGNNNEDMVVSPDYYDEWLKKREDVYLK